MVYPPSPLAATTGSRAQELQRAEQLAVRPRVTRPHAGDDARRAKQNGLRLGQLEACGQRCRRRSASKVSSRCRAGRSA
jgi:hypothetical protein